MRPTARRNARQFALQAIYSWQVSRENKAVIEENFLSDEKYDDPENGFSDEPSLSLPETDVSYFKMLLAGVINVCPDLDIRLGPCISRPIQGLDLVELALLRIAVYEMVFCQDVPYKVVINEAIELAKAFAAEDSYKFINSVLDKVASYACIKRRDL